MYNFLVYCGSGDSSGKTEENKTCERIQWKEGY